MYKIFQVCKISGDKQENIIVTAPANKELLTLEIFSFFLDFSVKSERFCKITHYLVKYGNYKLPFDFICLDSRCTPKEVNYLFIHLIIDKPNTKPTYYIKI